MSRFLVNQMRGWVAGMALAMMVCVGVARGEHYEVFVLAGQSNMDGRGEAVKLTGELEKYGKALEGVSIVYGNGPNVVTKEPVKLEPGYSVPPRSRDATGPMEKTFGPEIGFGHAMSEALPGKKILLIKSSKGGTSLKKSWAPDAEGSLYNAMIDLTKKTLKDLEAKGDSYTVRGFLWHQGESDNKLAAGEYETLFKAFAARLRKDLGNEKLPIVVGELCDDGTRNEVLKGLRGLPKSLEKCGIASVKDLRTRDKATHFDAGSQVILGKRYAEEMVKLLK